MTGRVASLLVIAAFAARSVHAQGVGVASIGASGGLHIPSAYVLGSGEGAFSLGNEQDPRLGSFSRRQNYTMGFGLDAGFELFGRLAEYQNPSPTAPGAPDVAGPRDLSANLKWRLPIEAPGLPKFAVGATDVNGGAVYFKSIYAVASDEWGPLRWSAGYARGTASRGSAKVLDGLFGGAEVRLWDSPVTALLESDGSRRHAGLRYYSEAIDWLGDAQLIGSVQRSFGASNPQGGAGDASSFNLSLVLPLQVSDASRNLHARAASKTRAPLPPIESIARVAPAEALAQLLRSLQSAGLERVRVGTLNADLVVEYENQRYLHNEVDALGVVLGLAAELAPAGTRRVNAITLKLGQVVSEASVSVPAMRAYLRDGDAAAMQSSLGAGRLAAYDASAVQWAGGVSPPVTRLRVAFKPLLNDTVGTEYGLFDYSLALQARISTPLWRGAQAYADVVQRVANSANMEPGRVFAGSRQRNGVQTLAVQQTFWLAENLLGSVGAGRYQHDSIGVEGESIYFVPARDDTLHLRGQFTLDTGQQPAADVQAASASYRWKLRPDIWLEGGLNQYTDSSRGPSVALTRWFGDVALQVFARKGGDNNFAGFELNLPLGPRQGMAAAFAQVSGSARFATGLRTSFSSGGNSPNLVLPDAVRPANPSYQAEVELLNSGRITSEYLRTQLARLRESFYLYGRSLLP